MPKLYQRIGHNLRPYTFQLLLAFSITILTVGLTLYLPILIGQAVDLFLGPHSIHWPLLLKQLQKMGLIVSLTVILEWAMSLIFQRVSIQVSRDLRLNTMDAITKVPIAFIDKIGNGGLISTLITDCDQFTDGLLLGLSQAFRSSLTILVTLVFMMKINYKLSLIVLLLTPLSLLSARFIAKWSFHYFKETASLRSKMSNLSEEIFYEAETVKSQEEEKPASDRLKSILQELNRSWTRAIFVSSAAMPVTRFINSCIYTLVACIGAYLVLEQSTDSLSGPLSIGSLTSFLAYASQYTKPFNDLSEVLTEGQNALASAERIYRLIEESPIADQGRKQLKRPLAGHIQFKDVSFAYPSGPNVIDHFSLDILPGQSIAIVGSTGSGKTTLINLLMRFYEVSSGQITIDGIDIRDIKRKELYQTVGMVLQDTWIKESSIRDNLCMGQEISDEDLLKVTKSLNVDDFIRQLPHGYDSQIGQGETSLSKGQDQLISIARLILRNPAILILDEATSSIDTRTELIIQKAFDQLTKNRTSIVIAHRLSTIEKADRIIVLEKGKIIESGNHQDLLSQKGHYYKMYTSRQEKANEA
ncbi:ABC transporter ATP-binding protein [Atopobacter sp. AH10]|uniref:ABC transporter ATP-binding protein n=1 Tax=Atopobacter sp. AH10 TaxID=2315861 RepID=UPI001314E0FC|nr:ABC transporter ATP-binding protein [Atopobacter sp. AH10]